MFDASGSLTGWFASCSSQMMLDILTVDVTEILVAAFYFTRVFMGLEECVRTHTCVTALSVALLEAVYTRQLQIKCR
jgi:hypothetical protein